MSKTHISKTRTSTRYTTLRSDLISGRNCEIGNYSILDSHRDSDNSESFKALIQDSRNSMTFNAYISVELSPYENLLADKVDLTIRDEKLTRTFTELTFTTSTELNHPITH